MKVLAKYFAIALFVGLTSLLIPSIFIFQSQNGNTFPARAGERWLLLIAHPDDETMFFAPTLLFLAQMGIPVHILCVTSGNSNGLGPIRVQELRSAAFSVYGIPSDRVHFVDPEESQFRDGFHFEWDFARLSDWIYTFLNKTKPIGVFTFDNFGISGHPNHRNCFEAVLGLKSTGKLKEIGVKTALALESVGIWQKYTGFADLIVTKYLIGNGEGSQERFFTFWANPLRPYKAMEKHRSQLVWFRYLYLAFSRYLYVNTFVPII